MGGRSSWNLFNVVVALILNLVLGLILVPRIGIAGAAVGLAGAILFNNVAPLVEVRAFLKVHPFGRAFLPVAASAALCFGGLGVALRLTVGESVGVLFAYLALASLGYLAMLYGFRERIELPLLWADAHTPPSRVRPTGVPKRQYRWHTGASEPVNPGSTSRHAGTLAGAPSPGGIFVPSSRPRRWRLRASIATLALLAAGALATSSVGAAPLGPVSRPPRSTRPQLANTGTTSRSARWCSAATRSTRSAASPRSSGSEPPTPATTSSASTPPSPYQVTTWDPNVNGEVNSIGFNGSDCSHAYIGGSFTSVGSTAVHEHRRGRHHHRRRRARRSPTRRRRRSRRCSARRPHPGRRVLQAINGSSAAPYMTSLDPTTGQDDGFLRLNISGNYSYAQQQRHPGLQPAAQQLRPVRPRRGRLHVGRRRAPAADLHARPLHDSGDGDRLDVARVGRQHGAPEPASTRPGTRTSACATSRSTSRPRPGRRTTRRSTSAPPATTRTAGRPGATRAPACATPRRPSRPPSTRHRSPTASPDTCCTRG